MQYGLIGHTPGDVFEFEMGTNPGITPDFTESYPTFKDPFNTIGDRPLCVTYYQNRLMLAGTLNDPHFIWGSATGGYRSFSRSIPLVDSDSIEAGIAANEVNTVLHMIGGKRLFLFTTSAVWVVEGDETNTITATGGFDPNEEATYGISNVRPLKVGDTILYVQAEGRAVRDVAYNFSSDTHQASDISIMSNHLFQGDVIVEWAQARVPDPYHGRVPEPPPCRDPDPPQGREPDPQQGREPDPP